MGNFIIFNLQNIASFVALYLLFRWWIQPHLDRLDQYDALLPVVFYHSIRFRGMMFMVDGQFYACFPQDYALVIGVGDYMVSLLAIFSSIALKAKAKIAIPMVWVTVIFGTLDLLNAFRLVGSQEFWKHDIEGIWYLMVLTGPIAFITSFYIIYRLVRPNPTRPKNI